MHRECDLVDDLAGVWTDRMTADDPVAGGDDHDLAAGCAVGPCTIRVGEFVAVNLYVRVLFDRLGFGEPDMGDLGIGERAPRHQLGRPTATREEHVPHGHRCVVGRGVREVGPTVGVADHIDRPDARAAAVVDDDTGRCRLDPETVEAECSRVRHPPGRHEEAGGG